MYGSSCVSTDTPAPTHEQPARTVVQTPVHAGRLLPTAVAVGCLGHNTASDLRVCMLHTCLHKPHRPGSEIGTLTSPTSVALTPERARTALRTSARRTSGVVSLKAPCAHTHMQRERATAVEMWAHVLLDGTRVDLCRVHAPSTAARSLPIPRMNSLTAVFLL